MAASGRRGNEPARYVGGTRTSAEAFRAKPSRDRRSRALLSRTSEFYTAQVFSGLFGGGMSSRLFQEVRENAAAFAMRSIRAAGRWHDAGLFGIHAATGPEMMGKLIDVVGAELKRAAEREAEPKPSWRAPRRSSRPAC